MLIYNYKYFMNVIKTFYSVIAGQWKLFYSTFIIVVHSGKLLSLSFEEIRFKNNYFIFEQYREMSSL